MEEEEKPVKKAKAEPVNVKKEAVAAVVAPIKKEEKKAQSQQCPVFRGLVFLSIEHNSSLRR